MALINCGECGKQVSDKAESCVGCGCPINKTSPQLGACPHCGSGAYEKIAGPMHRMSLGGSIFSSQQYHCHVCDHIW